MLVEKRGDILTFPGVIVSPVNCEGVSGAGLALQIKNKYPEADAWFSDLCKAGKVKPGTVCFSREAGVVFFPTKDQWRYPSKMEYIHSGLENFSHLVKYWDVKTIAFPLLGAGLGGLDIEQVKTVMHSYLDPLNLISFLYLK